MKKITNLIIVDASGSMTSKKEEVIGGLKDLFKMIKDNAKRDKDTVETTTIVCQFSTAGSFEVLVNTNDAKTIKKKLAENYNPNGMTALYDAIAQGFALVPKKQDGVFVNILTDGDENSSRETTNEDVKKLIEKKQSKNWVVTFMGTTQEAATAAQSWGVSRGNTMVFDNNARGVKMSSNARNTGYNVFYSATVTGKAIDTDNLLKEEEEAK